MYFFLCNSDFEISKNVSVFFRHNNNNNNYNNNNSILIEWHKVFENSIYHKFSKQSNDFLFNLKITSFLTVKMN